ncbi:MAG: two-component system chemotaxis family response regulator CheV [Nitrospirae bacterium]|nr:MAG: two-component system chemotaxis family response regulator CheV [Nitrospirota bacterium]
MARTTNSQAELMKVGATALELIVFKMFNVTADGTEETLHYGVNVAKVREIMPMPALTKVPDMPDYAEALTEVRGEVIPIIDLSRWMKIRPAQHHTVRPKVIVLSMMNTIVGMIVHDVERIRRISWDQVKQPPSMLQTKYGGKITGVTKIDAEGESLLLILDLESMMAEIGAVSVEAVFDAELGDAFLKNLHGTVMVADDSAVARKIIKDNLETRGLKVIACSDGKEALAALHQAKARLGEKPITDYIQLLITDVEMPEMDGITLASTLKSDDRFKSLPIIVNTSLSGDESKEKAKSIGADGYLVKFDIAHLIQEVAKFLPH